MSALGWVLFAACCIASALVGWELHELRDELAEQPLGDDCDCGARRG
ncbi:hypothetical protein ACQP1P_38695 [Dactylosporangium sp. CA-052675]